MDKIQVNTQLMGDYADDWSVIESEFTHAKQRSDVLADTVGDGELAERVRNFAYSWEQCRKKLVEQVGSLVGSLRRTFVDGADTLRSATPADKFTSASAPGIRRSGGGQQGSGCVLEQGLEAPAKIVDVVEGSLHG
jgi:hypothetical protein